MNLPQHNEDPYVSPKIYMAHSLTSFRSFLKSHLSVRPSLCILSCILLSFAQPSFCCNFSPQYLPRLSIIYIFTYLAFISVSLHSTRIQASQEVCFVYFSSSMTQNSVQNIINTYLLNECILAHNPKAILIKLRHFILNEVSPFWVCFPLLSMHLPAWERLEIVIE